MKILVLAGDLTNYYLSKLLKDNGYNIDIEGFNHLIEKPNRKGIVVKGYKTIIVPIPFTIDNNTLYAPYSDESIHIDDLLRKADSDATIIGGPFNISDNRLKDITKDKEFLQLNVVPTCEEIVKIIIDKSDITINNSKILVIGNGLIHKSLLPILTVLGAILIEKDNIENSDIIINTSKQFKFSKEILSCLKKSVVVLDITPNETNYKAVKKAGINIIKARGLPGKSAPKTVSNYIYNTLTSKKLI